MPAFGIRISIKTIKKKAYSCFLMQGYKFIEGLTVADVAFEAYGKTLDELFENCALAVFDVNVDLKTVKAKKTVKIKVKGKDLENLLFNFIDELIFVKDKDFMVFNEFKAKVKANEEFSAECAMKGDTINHEKQELRVDVKAVTMHHFSVKKEKGIYKAVVVLDI